MNCPGCQHVNRPSAKFCDECGARLQRACPHCGVETRPTAKFCDECGTPLAAPGAAPAGPSPTAARRAEPRRAERELHLEEQFATLQQALPTALRDHLLTPQEGETRIVTVLFADMSSSVRITADLHPEDAADHVNRLLKQMVDVLLKYEGRVDRFLGDGLLAVFGVPQAHESDPERAIRAALDIREAAQTLGVQITAGINTGEVYVGGMGSERHQEITVMGPVVNLAARLQGKAEAGQILVGEATYRHTRRAFEFAPLSLEIKGIDAPVTGYAVERPLARPERVRGIEGLRAELIGRDEEFTKLRAALADVLQGRGQMVSLIGEAGVGKSRLVAELKAACGGSVKCEVLSPQDATANTDRSTLNTQHSTLSPLWLEGRCLELGITASYWLFVDLFREYFAWRPEEDDRARGQRLAASLRKLVEQGDLSEERFEEMGPLLGNLLSIRFGSAWDERLKNASPEQIKHQTFLAVRDFLSALARRQPIILVFEDLHWADTLSLDLISLLMETLTRDPLLLLCVYRPEREHKCWRLGALASQRCAERYTELHLRELTPLQSRRLVESLLTIDSLPASIKELILEKSHGNPFFVEEVVRSLIDTGMVYREGEVWRAREGIETLAVPESVQSVILSRVDRLSQDLKRVLQSASIIGRLFRLRLLEYTLQEETRLEQALWELEDRQLIFQERVVPEEEYSFKHVLMQETIYQNILRRHRVLFHQKVAEAMEALYQEGLHEYYEQLAYHYERSGAEEKAVEYLLKAGDKAQRAYLNEEALEYFRRALERLEAVGRAVSLPSTGQAERMVSQTSGQANGLPYQDWRLAALQGMGRIYHRIGEESAAEEKFRQAIAVGKEMGLAPRALVRLFWWFADVLYWQDRYSEMLGIAEEGLALLGEDTQSVEAALMNETAATYSSHTGDQERHRDLVLRNAQFIEHLPYSEELRTAYTQIVTLYLFREKNVEEARKWEQAFERTAKQHHDLKALAHLYDRTGDFFASRGDLRGAMLRHQQALELYTKIGDTKDESTSLLMLGSKLLWLGDLPKAEACIDRAAEIAESVCPPSQIAWSYSVIGRISLALGAWEKAVDALQKITRFPSGTGRTRASPTRCQWIGRAYLAQGERKEALLQFQEAIVLSKANPVTLAAALNGLERACEDPDEFQAFCRRIRAEHAESADTRFVQWFLEPTQVQEFAQALLRDEFAVPLSSDWVWQDPFHDCSFTVENGLEIHAANGRDLWRMNLSAPRVLRPVAGDFAVQTVCVPAAGEKPTLGGILLWKDNENFLRLDQGPGGEHEIAFTGSLGSKEVSIGRGRLLSDRAYLRLERRGNRVSALCSADNKDWFTVGHVEFPVEDPVEVGLFAVGMIDRTIYHGAYPDGTAIRFEAFEMWGGAEPIPGIA